MLKCSLITQEAGVHPLLTELELSYKQSLTRWLHLQEVLLQQDLKLMSSGQL